VTILGTQLGTDLADQAELASLELYLAQNLWSWKRSDACAVADGKVTAFYDKVLLASEGALYTNARSVHAGHAWAQSNGPDQVLAPVSSPIFNSKEAIEYDGLTQLYVSTLPASAWSFTADNLDMFLVSSPGSTSSGVLVETFARPGVTNGSSIYRTGSSVQTAVCRATGGIAAPASAIPGALLDVADVIELRVDSGNTPNIQLTYKGTTTTAALAGAYGTATQSMVVGNASTGVIPERGREADLLIANRQDATLRTKIKRYILLRYGIEVA
jgi:hypothetical protein